MLLRSFSKEGLGRGWRRTLRVHVEEMEVVGGGNDALYAVVEIIRDGDVGGDRGGSVVVVVGFGVAVGVAVALRAVGGVGIAGFLTIVGLDMAQFVAFCVSATRGVWFVDVLVCVDSVAVAVAVGAGSDSVVGVLVVATSAGA